MSVATFLKAPGQRITLCANSTLKNGKRYSAWQVRESVRGVRLVRRSFALRKEAETYAKSRAQILTGQAALLSPSDLLSFRAGIQNLYGCGVTLEAATADYRLARRELGQADVSMVELARFWKAQQHGTSRKTVSEVVGELLESRRAKGVSAVHLRDLDQRLRRFAKSMNCPISGLSAPIITDWLAALRGGRHGQLLSPRSMKNFRGAIGNLLGFAVGRKYLPASYSEMKFVTVPIEGQRDIEIFTLDEMRLLLSYASQTLLPVLVLGGFAGLRTSETREICWENIHWTKNLITVPRGKTGPRKAWMPKNLKAWLIKIRNSTRTNTGRIVRIKASSVTNGMRRTIDKINAGRPKEKIRWKRNGLRHSFVSYWSAFEHDLWKVSEHTGHGLNILKRNYQREDIARADGKAWFQLHPADATIAVHQLKSKAA